MYEEWVGRTVTLDKMEQLQVSDVAPIYKKNYWNRVKGDQLPSGLDLCVFDFGVNAGTGQVSDVAKYLQKMIGATADGAIVPTEDDPATLRRSLHSRNLCKTRGSKRCNRTVSKRPTCILQKTETF